jgi:SAM-dependent methyltransferase
MRISTGKNNFHPRKPSYSVKETIGHIADAVRVSEINIFGKQQPLSISKYKLAYQPLDVKSPALYIPADVRIIYDVLDYLDTKECLQKEEIKVVDLGCGCGGFLLPFAAYSRGLQLRRFSATGYDLSPSLLAGAQKIAEEQNINNARFIEKDFTQLLQDDFKKFNFIYIFCPFIKDLADIMDDVYPRIAPETLLLTRSCPDQGVLKSDMFKLVEVPLEGSYGDEFLLYRRTSEKLLIH